MKIAIVHDWLVGMRGGEKCLEVACEIFPEADLFTLVHAPGAVSPVIERHRITTSWLNRIPGVTRRYRWLLPLYPGAVESLDLEGYDRVLSMSHAVAKGAKPGPDARHVCYCFSPMRYVWDLYDEYFADASWIRRIGAKWAAPRLRRWDVDTLDRVDRFVAISAHIQDRISRCYGRPSTVLHPPVEDAYLEAPLARGRGEYFLVVSALEPYKRIDRAIAAAARTGEPLWIVGTGSEERRLRRNAPQNVRFLGWQPPDRLPALYAKARALLFPGIEDFGIAPVECQAVGRPVVAWARGGALETVVGAGRGDPPTGILYEGAEGTVDDLLRGIDSFRAAEGDFDPEALRAHARSFRRERFAAALREIVLDEAAPC